MKPYRGHSHEAIRTTLQSVAHHLPVVVLLLSISVNVLLASRLLRAQQPPEHSTVVGLTVKPFAATSPSGDPILVKFEGPLGTILYHFNTACGWCERNWDNVRALVHETQGHYRFIGVSTTAVSPAFMRDHHLDFDVAVNVSEEIARQYGLAGTPQTIVVSPQGRVVKSWAGAYVGALAKDLGSFFTISLPGLASPRAVTHMP
jgi:peroxiredoxin